MEPGGPFQWARRVARLRDTTINKWIGSEGLLWPEMGLPHFILKLNIINGHYEGRLASCQILNPVACCARYLLCLSVAHMPDGSRHMLPARSFQP